MPYIEIKGIFDSELTNLTDFFNAVVISLDHNNNNDTNNNYISKEIMTYIYFFTHQLYYNFTTIKSIAPNLVVIIYHKDTDKAILVIDNNLLITNSDLFIAINNSVSIINSRTAANLENTITIDNSINIKKIK